MIKVRTESYFKEVVKKEHFVVVSFNLRLEGYKGSSQVRGWG